MPYFLAGLDGLILSKKVFGVKRSRRAIIPSVKRTKKRGRTVRRERKSGYARAPLSIYSTCRQISVKRKPPSKNNRRKKNGVGLAEGEMRRNARPPIDLYYTTAKTVCQSKISAKPTFRAKKQGRAQEDHPNVENARHLRISNVWIYSTNCKKRCQCAIPAKGPPGGEKTGQHTPKARQNAVSYRLSRKISANSASVSAIGLPFILLDFRAFCTTAGKSSSFNPNSAKGGTFNTLQSS